MRYRIGSKEDFQTLLHKNFDSDYMTVMHFSYASHSTLRNCLILFVHFDKKRKAFVYFLVLSDIYFGRR